MNAIGACGKRDVETIVDQQPGQTAARDLCRTRDEFVENSRAQVLFANLKERNLRSYSSFRQVKDANEIIVVRSCLTLRRAARYRVQDWAV